MTAVDADPKHFAETSARPGARPALRRTAQSLRRRILLIVATIDLGCCLAAAAAEVVNARRAARVEVAASLELAEPLVRETVSNFSREIGRDIGELVIAPTGIRHVRIAVHRPDGELVASRSAAPTSAAAPAPQWFARLIASAEQRVEIPVVAGELKGLVIIHGEDADEIAEVWEDMTSLGALFIGLNGLGLAIFGLALRRVTAPLGELADGLSELEQLRLDRRLPIPPIRELAALAERFNALAAALGQERETNDLLSRRMISLQDDERRQIAGELHDELGPCLFGLRANLALLERDQADETEAAAHDRNERLRAALEISERLQDLNRDLLRRLKPIALGEAPLAEVIAGLVAEFQRRHPACALALCADTLATGYDETIDLTIYRCVQEGVTNALKHANCSRIDVAAGELPGRITLSVSDDGKGVPENAEAGFGLTGLRERIEALRGRTSLRSSPDGARLEVEIPVKRNSSIARVGGR
ncbi:MAG: ATP-binding protein [Hansschlegelia sp.]